MTVHFLDKRVHKADEPASAVRPCSRGLDGPRAPDGRRFIHARGDRYGDRGPGRGPTDGLSSRSTPSWPSAKPTCRAACRSEGRDLRFPGAAVGNPAGRRRQRDQAASTPRAAPAAAVQSVGRARRNVAHHYDIDGAIYDCSSIATGNIPAPTSRRPPILEEAQLAKKRHLAAKLAIEPGQRVLDIGSGWGGLGLYLAKARGADVTGVTLSSEQLKISRERAAREGLSRPGAFRVQGLPQGRGHASTASCRSACSSTSASTTTRHTSARCASC